MAPGELPLVSDTFILTAWKAVANTESIIVAASASVLCHLEPSELQRVLCCRWEVDIAVHAWAAGIPPQALDQFGVVHVVETVVAHKVVVVYFHGVRREFGVTERLVQSVQI